MLLANQAEPLRVSCRGQAYSRADHSGVHCRLRLQLLLGRWPYSHSVCGRNSPRAHQGKGTGVLHVLWVADKSRNRSDISLHARQSRGWRCICCLCWPECCRSCICGGAHGRNEAALFVRDQTSFACAMTLTASLTVLRPSPWLACLMHGQRFHARGAEVTPKILQNSHCYYNNLNLGHSPDTSALAC